jgi:3-hydroxyisobutyrate dehydrogenase-like beta-hydroxyacid dehydrogenase
VAVIGFVGLGEMGGRIVRGLLAAGNVVYGTNRTKSRADPLVERGLIWRDSPRAVAAEADVVFSMVTDNAALEAITTGPNGILAGLRPGSVYVDMSTVSPALSLELACRVKDLDALMLEAPVSGTVKTADTGSLTIRVGGDVGAFARVGPLLRQFGETVRYVGENGEALWTSPST